MEDEYIVEEYSDEDYDSSSSDDDVQIFLKKECGLLEVEDDFEAEVDQVMTAHLQKLNGCAEEIPANDSASTSKTETSKKSDEQAKQDKINDDLFYDPNMDDEDEKWVNEKRRSYIYPSSNNNNKGVNKELKPLPNSDAVLNCPACLSLLCLDCQRHDVYKSQYRAMFVSNCTVIDTETLSYSSKKKFKKKKENSKSDNEKEVFNPVRCSVCNTEVAVYDKDEIFHFFNVLASY